MVKSLKFLFLFKPRKVKSIQKLGYLRDVKGQFITPLLIFKRTSVSRESNNFQTPSLQLPEFLITHLKIFQNKQIYTNFYIV